MEPLRRMIRMRSGVGPQSGIPPGSGQPLPSKRLIKTPHRCDRESDRDGRDGGFSRTISIEWVVFSLKSDGSGWGHALLWGQLRSNAVPSGSNIA